MYIFWPALVIFVVIAAIGLIRERILWNRDRAEDARHIEIIADAWIRSLKDDDHE